MRNESHTRMFEAWLEEVGIDTDHADWSQRAADLLGKSSRMCAYYREGRPIPLDTLYLMDCVAKGYRPRKYATAKV